MKNIGPTQKFIIYIYFSILICLFIYVPIKSDSAFTYQFIWIDNNFSISLILFNVFATTLIFAVLVFVFNNSRVVFIHKLQKFEPIIILMFIMSSIIIYYCAYKQYIEAYQKNVFSERKLIDEFNQGVKLQSSYKYKIEKQEATCTSIKFMIYNDKDIRVRLAKYNIDGYSCWDDIKNAYNNYISGKSKIRLPLALETDFVNYSITGNEYLNYIKGEALINSYNDNMPAIRNYKNTAYNIYLINLSNKLLWLYLLIFPFRYFIYIFLDKLLISFKI